MNSTDYLDALLNLAKCAMGSREAGDVLSDVATAIKDGFDGRGVQVLRAVECSADQSIAWTSVLSLPEKFADDPAQVAFMDECNLPTTVSMRSAWLSGLPWTKQAHGTSRMLFGLSGFGALALEKNGPPFDAAITRRLVSVLADIGCAVEASARQSITRAKQEELLLFRAGVEQSMDGIVLTDMDGNVRFVNDAWAVMHGYAAAELTGRHLSIFHTKEQMTSEVEPFLVRLNKDGVCNGEMRHVRRNGETFVTHMTTSVLHDASGRRVGFIAIARDNTERLRAERTLAEEATRRRILVEQSSDGIVVLDQDGRVYEANRKFAEMLGYSMAEAHQLSVFDWDYRLSRDKLIEMLSTIDEHGAHFETRHRRKNGTTYDVEISTNAAMFGDRKLVFCVCRDISERKRVEETARRERIYQDLINRLATRAIRTHDRLRFEKELLSLLGEALDVSRTYIFVHRYDTNTSDNTAEWTAPGIDPQIQNLQGIRDEYSPWWAARLRGGEEVWFADIEDIPDEGARAVLRPQGIKSILILPLFLGGRYFGFMGFDECRRRREWTVQERNVLAEASRILMNVLAEEGLREGEQRLQGIFRDVGAVAVQVCDADGRVRYWNRASERFYGYGVEEALGRNLLELIIPPAWRDRLRDSIHQMVESGEAIPPAEMDLVRKDGSWIPVYLSFATDRAPGRHRELFFIQTDMSEIRRSEFRFRSLFEHHSAIMLVLDPGTGDIIDANPAAAAFYGWTQAQLRHMNIQQINLLPPAAIFAVMAKARSREQTFFEFRHRRADGSIRDVAVFSSSIEEADRSVLYSIIYDITAVKEAEADRARLQAELIQAQKMETVGRLAGGVAHDFNNMLGVINGYSHLVLDRLGADDPLRDHLQQILLAGERSAALTRQLLAFSRKQPRQPEVLDLNALIRNLEKMLHRVIGEDIDLDLVLAEDLGTVMADPGQIEQVIMNLSVNARDAMPSGGRLSLATDEVALDHALPGALAELPPGTYVRLCVTDTGIGMDAETQAHAFEPFFTTKESGKGTGLGLPTVYGIIRQSGGGIDFDSRPGSGTTFMIYLPRGEGTSSTSADGEDNSSGHSGKGERILLVEDEHVLREVMSHVLTRMNYDVIIARDGEEALSMVEQQRVRPDVVITDMVMPHMNGRELIENLRRTMPGLKFLVMSGYSEDSQHIPADIPFIQKPAKLEDLSAKLRLLLDPALAG